MKPIVDERHALLQRILWSRQIERSGRIREFLSYVWERSLADPDVEIHEQEIGHAVFGRPADYDTALDNIVRVTASQARRKLELYFRSDGGHEPVILEIPKGQYTPVFRARKVIEEAEIAPVQVASGTSTAAPVAGERIAVLPSPDSSSLTTRYNRLLAGSLLSIAVLLAVVVYLGIQVSRGHTAPASVLDSSPNLNALWGPILAPNSRTDLVVTDSSLSLFQELLDHQLTLAEYLKPDWTSAQQFASNPQLQAFAKRAAQHQFTSLANVTFAYRAARLTGRDPGKISVFSARGFNIRQMQSDNVVLLGSSRANPWVELIADRLKFRYAYDQKLRYSYFENRKPGPGEPLTFQSNSGVSFCHIAFVPNLGKNGVVLQISGTEVEGTEGGGKFLTDERSLQQLRSVVPIGHDGKFPYFEILLKSTRVGGVAPHFSIVSGRVLQF